MAISLSSAESPIFIFELRFECNGYQVRVSNYFLQP